MSSNTGLFAAPSVLEDETTISLPYWNMDDSAGFVIRLREGAQTRSIPTEIKGIVGTPGVYGGWPCIEGHRIAVHDIAEYIHRGYTAEQVVSEVYTHLSLAQVHAAFYYYYEHKEEIDREIAEDVADVKRRAQESMSPFAQKLRQHIKERHEKEQREKGQGV